MKLRRLLAALALLLLGTLPSQAWFGRIGGGAPGGGGGPVLLGTITDVNTGAAESNVPRRRGFALARGQMPTAGGTNGSGTGSTFTDSTCACFYPQDVGISLNITSPGSGLTTGTYIIASYVSANSVTLTPAPGVTLGTGSGASWMASTPVGSGYTFKLVDCNSNVLTYGQDEIATYNGEAGSTDVQDIRHVVFSYIEPTIGAVNTTCPISIYRIAGTYSPGTPLPISAVTAAHNYIDYFGSSTYPVKDAANAVQGSGQYQWAFNTYAAAPFSASFGSTGYPGGYRVMLSSQDETCWDVSGEMTDVTGGAPHPWIYEEMYVCAWQTTPGSGTLGHVEMMPKQETPWPTNSATGTAPSSYWGARSVYDGATLLRTWQTTYTFAPSAVTTGLANDYGYGPGLILNPNNIQQGEPWVFNVTGGGSNALPGGLTAGQLTFLNSYNSNGVVTPFWPNLRPNLWYLNPDITLTSQGVCASGNCLTMTRMAYVGINQGAYLPADDQGNPFWFPARTAVLYPQMTTAERTAMSETGMAPPFSLTPPTTSPNTLTYPADWIVGGAQGTTGNPNLQPMGPSYRPDSLSAQSLSISNGGNHSGIGVWSDWQADWWKTQTAVNWDYVRTTALARESMLDSEVLNVATGDLIPFDNGPNSAGASYPTLGVPQPGTFNLNSYQAGLGVGYVGFTTPVTPTYDTIQSWYAGIAAGNIWSLTGGETGTDHWPAMGQAVMFMIEGSPWFLDEVYRDFSYVESCQWTGTGAAQRGDPFTIGSTNYYATLPFVGEAPRSGAWAMRSLTEAASLGADGNPDKIYAFSVLRQNIRYFHDAVNVYETNSNFRTFGETSLNLELQQDFMGLYGGMSTSYLHDRFRQDESAIVPGATTLYMINYYLRHNIQMADGQAGIGPRWQFTEDTNSLSGYSGSGAITPSSPWISNFNQEFVRNPDICSMDYTGTCTDSFFGTGDNNWGQYEQAGDQILPFDDPNTTALLGTSPYYVCNFVATTPDITYQLSVNSSCSPLYNPNIGASFTGSIFGNTLTVPGAITGAIISPLPYVGPFLHDTTGSITGQPLQITAQLTSTTWTVSGSPQTVASEAMTTTANDLNYIFRPTNPTTAWVNSLIQVGGYLALGQGSFHMGTGAGATEPNLSAALTQVNSLYNHTMSPTWYTPANTGVDWMMWDMTNITVQ